MSVTMGSVRTCRVQLAEQAFFLVLRGEVEVRGRVLEGCCRRVAKSQERDGSRLKHQPELPSCLLEKTGRTAGVRWRRRLQLEETKSPLEETVISWSKRRRKERNLASFQGCSSRWKVWREPSGVSHTPSTSTGEPNPGCRPMAPLLNHLPGTA